MTTIPSPTHPAGRELDALVAERVMGWKRPTKKRDVTWYRADGSGCGAENIPHYSTDISVAWQVVEKMCANNYSFDAGSWENMDDGNNWYACFEHSTEVYRPSTPAPTMPLAICRASLAAMLAARREKE